jgi:hypothetical protein
VDPTAFQNLNAGTIAVPNTAGPYTIGFRMVVTNTMSHQALVIFQDATSGAQVTISTNVDGTFRAELGGFGGTLIGDSTAGIAIAQNVWNYIECLTSVSATVGIVTIMLNGVQIFTFTGNTKAQATAIIGFIKLGTNSNTYIQDVYVLDSTGTYNNTFLGDCRISAYNAAGVGTAGINQYTANGAATVWQCTKDATPDDDATYASDNTPGDRMSVTAATTALTGGFAAVVHVSRVRKDDAGTRTVAQTITSGGVDAVASNVNPGTSYAYHLQISEVDPNTSVPWLQAGFNAVQMGLETVV